MFFFKIFIYSFGCTRYQLWPVGSIFPDQGLNPGPLCWECRVLITGPPGMSLSLSILMLKLSPNWPVIVLQVDLWVHLTPPSNSLPMYVLCAYLLICRK